MISCYAVIWSVFIRIFLTMQRFPQNVDVLSVISTK